MRRVVPVLPEQVEQGSYHCYREPVLIRTGLCGLHNISIFSPFQTFRREGNDLSMTHKIGLVEALCGFQFMLKHLDGRQIVIKYPAGKVIEPGQISSSLVL